MPAGRCRWPRLMLLAAGLAAAASAARGAGPEPGRLLPSETCRGFFIVPVTVAGERLDLLLDTGSSWTLVDPAAARRVTGREVRRGKVALAGARLGELRFDRLRARVLGMAALGRAVGRPIDGILGFPAFRDVLLTLDYPRAEVRYATGNLPPADGRRVFRDIRGRRPWLEVGLDGHRLELLLDSGASPGHLQLRRSDHLEWATPPRPAAAVTLVQGVVIDDGGRLEQALRFGSLTVDSPVAFVTGREPLAGWMLLRHFALTFDQRNRRIRLDPGDAPARVTVPPYVGKGFAFSARPEGWKVVAVFAGTPAARSDLRPGDLITAVDGTPVYERPACEEPGGSAEGTKLRLTRVRDGVPAAVEISTVTLVP